MDKIKKPEIERILPNELHYRLNILNDFFKKENIVSYSILGETLQEVVEDEQEDMTDREKKTPEMPLVAGHASIEVVNNTKQILLPPEKQLSLEAGDFIYINHSQILFEKLKSLSGSKIVYVYEHKPTEAELLGNAYTSAPN